MIGYIYLITNKLNNKQYIGLHHYDKLELDPNYWCGGIIIKDAINKYGKENFIREIIDTADSDKELVDKETYWIKKKNTITPNGYNILESSVNYSLSDELKEKIRIETLKHRDSFSGENHYLFNKHLPEETRRKISETKKGQIPWNKGLPKEKQPHYNIKHLEETKYKISESNKGKHHKSHTEETKKKISEASKGNTNTKGKKWIHNVYESKLVDSSKLEYFLENGYTLGRK